MNKATRAALLSGRVFPGLGHVYLWRWVTDALLAGVTSHAVYTFGSVVLRVTRDIAR